MCGDFVQFGVCSTSMLGSKPERTPACSSYHQFCEGQSTERLAISEHHAKEELRLLHLAVLQCSSLSITDAQPMKSLEVDVRTSELSMQAYPTKRNTAQLCMVVVVVVVVV